MPEIFAVFETVAVVGATGAVGRIMVQLLQERDFPARRFRFLASKRSAGSMLVFKGREYIVEELTRDAFDGVELVISSTPDDVARDYLPAAVAAGATVIDESGYFRMRPDVAARHSGDQSAGGPGRDRASSPAPTVRRRKWSWRSSRCTTRPASAA